VEDLNDKITGGTLSAAEWNQVPSELQNVIEQLGLALSNGDLNQLGKAIAGYVGGGDFYTGGGAANAQTLTKIGTKQAPAVLLDGLRVRWRPSVNNTAGATINVNSLGAKSVVREDASALSANDLGTTRDALARYDLANDRFVLANSSLPSGSTIIHSGAKARKSGGTQTSGGNGTTDAITFDSEIYDDGGWFAPTSGDFTVPAGVTKVSIVASCEIATASANGDQRIEIFKNGAAFAGGDRIAFDGTEGPSRVVLPCVAECVPGDVFSVRIGIQAGGSKTVNNGNYTWMAITAIQKA